ncbi:MAG: PHP domain-containing protein [Christensenellales bacterium]
MAYWGDYHTHTYYSHGKGTIEDNVRAAAEKGLKQIAITDHGFRHMMYNVRHMDLKKCRRT